MKTSPQSSNTPRTDAVAKESHEKHVHLNHQDCHTSYWCFRQADTENFARTLERELNEAYKNLQINKEVYVRDNRDDATAYKTLQKEAEQLRSDLKMCAEALEQLGFIAYPAHGSGFMLVLAKGNTDLITQCLSNPRIQASLKGE